MIINIINNDIFASLKLQGLSITGDKINPVPIEFISQVLGHTNITTTQKHYAKFTNNSSFDYFLE